MPYRLTRKAEDDIVRIYLEGGRLFGVDQAERYHSDLEAIFNVIADNPKLARERHEIRPPVRVHPHKSHLIIYLAEQDGDVLVVRIRHAREDWESDPA